MQQQEQTTDTIHPSRDNDMANIRTLAQKQPSKQLYNVVGTEELQSAKNNKPLIYDLQFFPKKKEADNQ